MIYYLSRYQIGLGTSMKGDCVYLPFYKCHKINPNCGGYYTDSSNLIKNQKATINPINENDKKCFQYAATLALIHKELEMIQKEQQKLNL